MSTAITGHLVQNPHSSDDSRIISVDPSARTGRFRDLRDAIDYAKARATLANPFIIKILPGITPLSNFLDLQNAIGVHLIGYGRGVSILQPPVGSEIWYVGGSVPDEALINMAGASGCSVQNLMVDGQTTATARDESLHVYNGVSLRNATNCAVRNCRILAELNGVVAANTTPLANRLEVTDCEIEAFLLALSVGGGTWRVSNSSLFARWSQFASDLQDDGGGSAAGLFNSAFLAGLNILDGGSCKIETYGCDIAAEAEVATNFKYPVGVRNTSDTNLVLRVVGSRLSAKNTVSDLSSVQGTSAFESGAVSAAATVRTDFVGSGFFVETGAVTDGYVGGVVVPGGFGSQSLTLVGCGYVDVGGSGGRQRGGIVRKGALFLTGTGTVRTVGGSMGPYVGPLNGSAVVFDTKEPNRKSGSATLASGSKIVLLITDAGNGGGATDCTFNASATVNTDVDLTSVYKHGDYIKAASHSDAAWTQIKNTSATALTLVETYRGGELATTQGKRGTPTDDTQPNGTYQVSVTAAITGETFGVTTKHGSGFTITSSNGASTATVDWMLVR